MMKLWIGWMVALFLTACGQSGDLFIPKDETVATHPAPVQKPGPCNP